MNNTDYLSYGFAKDCASNFEKGVPFTVRFIWGSTITQDLNVPRFAPELMKLSASRKREVFENALLNFLDIVDKVAGKEQKEQLKVQYLPLQADSFTTITNIKKQ